MQKSGAKILGLGQEKYRQISEQIQCDEIYSSCVT